VKSRSGRVNITNLQTPQNRRDVLVRFHAAYKDTIEWMYSDPAALKIFSEFTNLPERVVNKVRELVPKETLGPRPDCGCRSDHRGSSQHEIFGCAADA
jgi:NitT/TauT family transport system substrate-binding protein